MDHDVPEGDRWCPCKFVPVLAVVHGGIQTKLGAQEEQIGIAMVLFDRPHNRALGEVAS